MGSNGVLEIGNLFGSVLGGILGLLWGVAHEHYKAMGWMRFDMRQTQDEISLCRTRRMCEKKRSSPFVSETFICLPSTPVIAALTNESSTAICDSCPGLPGGEGKTCMRCHLHYELFGGLKGNSPGLTLPSCQ
jgi:hypothetical protein